jgi:hypothetical protein
LGAKNDFFVDLRKTGIVFDPFLEKIEDFWDICFSKIRRKPEKYIFLKFDISFKFVFLT